MVNIKNQIAFYDVISGNSVSGERYGLDAAIFKKVDNMDTVFDSRGKYLGTRTCRGKIVNGKYTGREGIRDFKSFLDLKIWAGIQCPRTDFIDTKDGTFIQITM